MSKPVPHHTNTLFQPNQPLEIWYQRKELDEILRIYGFMVSAGEWRDYAIDGLKDRAVFSIYQRTSDVPAYTVEKRPALARKQGQYAVINSTGQILKRGHTLAAVLKVFDKKRLKIVD